MVRERIREQFKTFGIAFFVLFFSFVAFLNPTFTSDSVWDSFDTNVTPFSFFSTLSGGRFLQFIFRYGCYLLNKIHISKFENQYVFQLLTLILLAWTVTVLVDLFEEIGQFKNRLVLTFVFLFSFVNSFFIETFVYVGLELAIAILISVYAVKLFVRKHYFWAAFSVLLAVGTYQSYVALFLIFSTLALYVREKCSFSWKNFFEYLKMLLVAGVPCVISVGSIQVYSLLANSDSLQRYASAGSGFQSVTKEVSLYAGLWDRMHNVVYAYAVSVGKGFGMYPTFLLFGLIVFIGFSIVITMHKKAELWFNYGWFLLIFLLLNLYPVSLFALSTATMPAPRICWPVFATISSCLVISLEVREGEWKGLRFLPHFQKIIIALVAMINLYSIVTCELDFFMGNALDKQICYQVQAEIERYERSSGNSITQVCAVHSEDGDFYYEQQFLNPYFEYTYNHKTLYYTWSDVELLDKATGNNYLDCSWYDTYPEDYQQIVEENFTGKHWNTFIAEEQLVFSGNTLYWAIY